mmetsp:Transcript_22824/g.34252  ORF Transcript_22824/g.34252 Transcript_22824/m.34252 type:complete len:207 (+) Transcript_22824:87-707(+)|eukprot:CAMPEP_0194756338 /NCGR_PEP_ID=MMETSP0323_2-20130528/10051_1 /TAXON_ID=2866 ORGANISM="Crypthecodinium cohnii, Strain Seligo" /NCGR_SAMPLE_ID=MMETSP0323_2 /ASSEMBLY_ACC=CAM_ASM_000346 /LENGTH=206 /DNA_ID=CAMNT_0039675797 /DNA_START=80 /DNA_END=700 /DNA_ORIENTATION=-
MAASPSELVGWYDLSWKGGTFEVCLRPCGVFFCPRFQAQASWELVGNVVQIDWKNFGKYEMTIMGADKKMEGHKVPKNEADEGNWRKASFNRPLSAEELALIGDGAGSEWDFQWSGGSFPVQFKADGYNHFKCEDFPAHAHWSMKDNKLFINWGEYGNYEMTINGAEKTMEGGSVGGDWSKDDWRKAKLVRNLLDNKVVEACEHHH